MDEIVEKSGLKLKKHHIGIGAILLIALFLIVLITIIWLNYGYHYNVAEIPSSTMEQLT